MVELSHELVQRPPQHEGPRLRAHGLGADPGQKQARQHAVGQLRHLPAGNHDEGERPVAPDIPVAATGVRPRQGAQGEQPHEVPVIGLAVAGGE